MRTYSNLQQGLAVSSRGLKAVFSKGYRYTYSKKKGYPLSHQHLLVLPPFVIEGLPLRFAVSWSKSQIFQGVAGYELTAIECCEFALSSVSAQPLCEWGMACSKTPFGGPLVTLLRG